MLRYPVSCNVQQKGTFILSLKEIVPAESKAFADFVIKGISLNTNKLVIKDRALNTEPITFYANNSTSSVIMLNYWLNGKEQSVTVGHNAVTLNESNRGKDVSVNLAPGLQKVSLPKGYAWIKNTNLALSPQHWFDIFIADISATNADFLLTEQAYWPLPVITEVSVEIK